MNGLALCAGVGGLELGIERVFDGYRTVCYVEGEAFSAAVLTKQMEKGRLHQAPIWSNLRTFDGEPWRGKVDIVSAGFPCQPFSQAGNQEGTEDPRHLWPEVARVVSEIRPSIIILENVPGVIVHAGASVAGDLAEMGYHQGWGIVQASDAAAHHKRARWFCVALNPHADVHGFSISRFGEESISGSLEEGSPIHQRGKPPGVCHEVSDTNGDGKSNEPVNAGEGRSIQQPISNTHGEGSQRLRYEPSEDHEGWRASFRPPREADNPSTRFIQSWTPEPGLGRMADGVAHWVDRLRACGNGVVPQQAELAVRIILEMLQGQHSKP